MCHSIDKNVKRQNGFTLVELLLVMLISSIIVLGIHAAYRQAYQICSRVEKPRSTFESVRIISDTLRVELSSIYFPKTSDANNSENPEGNPSEPIIVKDNLITFYTLNPAWRTDPACSRIARVTYSFGEFENTDQKVLVRHESLYAGEKPAGTKTTDVIADNLAEFKISLIKKAQNKEEKNPPKAVKLTLKFADSQPSEESFHTTIFIPSEVFLESE